jgi:hypothetical protein
LSADRNDGKYREYLIKKIQAEKIDFFDPFEYMCDSITCKIIEFDKIFYADSQHLSVFGGNFLAAAGREKLDILLQTRD